MAKRTRIFTQPFKIRSDEGTSIGVYLHVDDRQKIDAMRNDMRVMSCSRLMAEQTMEIRSYFEQWKQGKSTPLNAYFENSPLYSQYREQREKEEIA